MEVIRPVEMQGFFGVDVDEVLDLTWSALVAV